MAWHSAPLVCSCPIHVPEHILRRGAPSGSLINIPLTSHPGPIQENKSSQCGKDNKYRGLLLTASGAGQGAMNDNISILKREFARHSLCGREQTAAGTIPRRTLRPSSDSTAAAWRREDQVLLTTRHQRTQVVGQTRAYATSNDNTKT